MKKWDRMEVSRIKYFKNITSTSADFYIYGAIVDEKEADFWTGETSKTEIDINEMKLEIEELKKENITDFNIYINSPGGSVFASSTIVSLLKRFKQEKGVKIHSYIDGLCASAATYICMIADDVNIYQNSIMMIHKPLSIAYGNSDDFQKEIDTLNTIENNMMIPMYMNKFKKSEDELKNLIKNETWFNGNIFDEYYIGEFFNINYIDETKKAVALTNSNLLKNYKHIPKNIFKEGKEEKEEVKEKIDYSFFENKIKNIKEIKE